MPELRKDPIIGRWVIIATDRAKRPSSYVHAREEPKHGFCPFCRGQERHTPPEVLAYRKPGGKHDGPEWWVRVVPNKFPALQIEGPLQRAGEGMYDRMNGVGAHEVVIETPEHDVSLADQPPRQIQEVFWAFRDRIIELKKDRRFRYILIFKNHGREAGASLDHPHSQIIALPIVPKRVQEEVEGSRRYWDYKERCVFCDIIHQEAKDRVRIITENNSFVAIAPFASRFPFETWVLPKQHSLYFHEIQKNHVEDLADMMHGILGRMKEILDDPPYNFMIHTTPFEREDVPYYHWHIEVIPKLTRIAGFEWGTGFYINPTPPEHAARYLSSRTAEIQQIQVSEVR
ncbi:galactose-1-phosphate uridylyltransferase [candidate division BRC1 bacterium SM23_51]|nr:MAG: galactose-1-phosphate uridylyltransferase [candidate division BRC1 bacterium SM23_51]